MMDHALSIFVVVVYLVWLATLPNNTLQRARAAIKRGVE